MLYDKLNYLIWYHSQVKTYAIQKWMNVPTFESVEKIEITMLF